MEEQAHRSYQLITAKELGRMLNLSKRQIFRLNACGKIPAPIHIGGSIRWDVEREIKPWLAAGAPDRKTWQTLKEEAER